MVAKGRATNFRWLREGMIRASMLGKTMLPSDEELGKKDDDHQSAFAPRSNWSAWTHTFRWRRRRILLAVFGWLVVYFVFWKTGEGLTGIDDAPRSSWGRSIIPSTYQPPHLEDEAEPTGPPPGMPKAKHGEATLRTYNGPIRFFHLASTLRPSAERIEGYAKWNRNVLFTMSSLQSTSTLLPMICDMSKWGLNHVHAAFMGREDIPLEDLLQINGIDKAECPAIWHDARPDYTEFSSDARAESAVIGAMSHIIHFLHPQAVIMDDSLSEDASFVRAMRTKSSLRILALIEVPRGGSDGFTWITRLDADSLRHWHEPIVDLLIQVPPGSSNVLRLLSSIKAADYRGLKPPRITLELPADLDESVKQYIANFEWPPHNDHPLAGSGLTIRRRVLNHRATQEDSAIRFLELFYPKSTSNSHVLVLSPQAQLSPQYFHFVKYALLEYKYSASGAARGTTLMGVSLELPKTLLDAKSSLTAPTLDDMRTEEYKTSYPDTKSAPFLWQAPNSHATLLFGDKWAELHSFLGNRLMKHEKSKKPSIRTKLVSETQPSWCEYMLEFMRARGYSLLYPAMTSNAFVTIHNELYHTPEEFSSSTSEGDMDLKAEPGDLEGPFSRSGAPPAKPQNTETLVMSGSTPLHLALPFDGDLPEVRHLPQLLYDGTHINPTMVMMEAAEYANDFRKDVGGCTIPPGKHRRMVLGDTKDLFCFGDEDEDDWVSDGSKVDISDEFSDEASTNPAVSESSSVPGVINSLQT